MATARNGIVAKFGSTTMIAGLLLMTSAIVLAPHDASAEPAPPIAEMFYMSSLSATPGSQVALHWHAQPGDSFLLTSITPGALPGFGSWAVSWPANTSETWSRSSRMWSTTSNAVAVSIPPDATNGTAYRFQLYTCNAALSSCSSAPGVVGRSEVTVTVTSNWQTIPYSEDFFSKQKIQESIGDPLDVTFSPGGAIWNSSEFSSGLSEAKGEALIGTYFPDPANADSPFAACFGSCESTDWSALAERVVSANGLIWSTFGGWLFDSNNTVPNHSEIVALSPNSKTYCTYVVPGDDNEVIGLAVTDSQAQSRTWFVESNTMTGNPSLNWFSPSLVGDGCPGTNNEVYSLEGSLHTIPWPANDVPAQIAADDNSSDLWVTDYWGSEVDRVDANTGQITRYQLPTRNNYSFFGSEPWQLVADTGYVYVINYGDSTLVRINKATSQIDVVQIPLTSDMEQGYGLALSGGRLYFTLSDDGQPSFGAASTFGYISVSAWEAASDSCSLGTDCAPAPQNAVIYTGLTAPHSDYRGIAVGPGGIVAIADSGGIIRMIQRR